MEFNERLKNLRKEKQLTQRELAAILNYGSSAISNYESGKNQPSISDLKIISQYFNVSLDYLLCVNDIRNPYVIDDTSDKFNEFRQMYAKLTPDKIVELDLFLKWLIDKPAFADYCNTIKASASESFILGKALEPNTAEKESHSDVDNSEADTSYESMLRIAESQPTYEIKKPK